MIKISTNISKVVWFGRSCHSIAVRYTLNSIRCYFYLCHAYHLFGLLLNIQQYRSHWIYTLTHLHIHTMALYVKCAFEFNPKSQSSMVFSISRALRHSMHCYTSKDDKHFFDSILLYSSGNMTYCLLEMSLQFWYFLFFEIFIKRFIINGDLLTTKLFNQFSIQIEMFQKFMMNLNVIKFTCIEHTYFKIFVTNMNIGEASTKLQCSEDSIRWIKAVKAEKRHLA